MLLLDGESLRLDDVIRVACAYEPVGLAPGAVARMEASRAVVERLAAGDAPVYGVNTGFGLLSDVRVSPTDLKQLQRNLIRSHACGVGEPLPEDVVRALILFRANVLAKGYSGIRPLVAERLCEMLNRRATPGARQGKRGGQRRPGPSGTHRSGADRRGRRCSRESRPAHSNSEAKEGISLVNGTQAMLAMGAWN